MAVGNGVIGSLRVVLGLDTAQFDAGLKRTQASLKSLSFANLAGAAVGAATVTTLTAAFGALRNAMAFGDDIADTAKRLAVTTDALQEYRFAVHALGGDYKDADTALEGFAKAFGAAHAGLTKKAAKPFEALGLDPKTFSSTEDALQAVIKKIANLKSTAEQAAIADKLGIGAMLPALRDGAGAIEDLRKKAHDLGYVMDADLVEKAGDANDKFEDLTAILDVQLKSALVQLAPVVLDIAGGLNDAAKFALRFGEALNGLNQWGPSKALLRIMELSQGAGAATGKFLGTDQIGAKLGLGKPGQQQVTSAQMRAFLGSGKPAPLTGSLIPPSGGGGKGRGSQVAEASQRAIESAAKEELSAQIALTKNIETLAALRLKEIDTELATDNARLARGAAEGDITKAAAATAIASNERAAADKRALLQRETQAKLDDAEIASREAIGQYYDQIASITADMVGTAAERNRIEATNLADRQRLDRDRLDKDTAAAVLSGEMLESERNALLASQADLQAAERLAQAREARARQQEEDLTRATAGIDLQLSLLDSQARSAKSGAEYAEIQLRILELELERERIVQQAIVDSATSSALDKEIAAAKLGQLNAIKKSEIALAKYRIVEGAFNDLTNVADSVRDALNGGNWGGAVRDLFAAFKGLQTALQTGQGKLGAALGIANVAGQVIGGTAGGALSGAASGALAGFSFAGPAGAVVGGIIGGLGSLFGSSKAKKRAKAEAAARAAAEAQAKAEAEAARQLAIANEKRSLEIRLMELQGDAAGALAARREDELKAMDDSNDALQQLVWSLEDAAEATRKAQEASQQAQDAADQAANDARDALSDAFARQRSGLEDTIQTFQGLADSLRDFRESLGEQGGAKGLASAAAEFRKVSAAARLGDVGAMGNLQGVSQRFLEATQSTAKSDVENRRALAQVKSAVQGAEETAIRQVNIAQWTLDANLRQEALLLGINNAELSIYEAIVGLGAAINNQIATLAAAAVAFQDNEAATTSILTKLDTLISDGRIVGAAVAQNTAKTASTLQRFDGDGMPETRAA